VTAIPHWFQVQDLCMDLSFVAFSEFYFKSVLTGMKRFIKNLPLGLFIFPESILYSSYVPQGS